MFSKKSRKMSKDRTPSALTASTPGVPSFEMEQHREMELLQSCQKIGKLIRQEKIKSGRNFNAKAQQILIRYAKSLSLSSVDKFYLIYNLGNDISHMIFILDLANSQDTPKSGQFCILQQGLSSAWPGTYLVTGIGMRKLFQSLICRNCNLT